VVTTFTLGDKFMVNTEVRTARATIMTSPTPSGPSAAIPDAFPGRFCAPARPGQRPAAVTLVPLYPDQKPPAATGCIGPVDHELPRADRYSTKEKNHNLAAENEQTT
jgi:hypothetical protein